MTPGDLKYTFTDLDGVEQTAIVPAEVFREASRINLERNAAIRIYLQKQGYNIEVPKRAKGNLLSEKKTGTRSRKSNPTKRAIIDMVADIIADQYGNADIMNPERIVAFEIDGQKYELVLIAKRK